MSSALARGVARRPRTQPRRFRQPLVPREWRHRLEPQVARRTRRRRIVRGAMARIRGWLWWSLPWTIACTWALATDRWWWALGTGLMAALSQAIALRDPGLAFAVDHRMPVDSDAFLDSMVGSTGVPLLPGNTDRHPQQRRRVLPVDARGDRAAPGARSRSRPTSTGAARSGWSSRRRSPSGPRPACR